LAYANREDFDSALTRIIDNFQPRLVVLAGFMRILSSAFVSHYAGRLINIHPSLLPDFPGINTHQRALDANVTRHGASVHFVTEELDGGPVIARHSIPVVPADTPESLAARVLEQEHRLYPKVVAWFASGDLKMTERGACHASIPLPHTHEIE
jgi:phosphoribosylglycinamide formyltransferase-1